MIAKIKNSLAYRLPKFYKKLLSVKPLKAILVKPDADIAVLMMTGEKMLDMTRLTVFSMLKYWSALPELIVVTDGSATADRIKQQLSFWPGKLTVSDWQQTELYHLTKKRNALTSYANRHVLIRKLAAILHYAELGPVMWLDSDILFYSDFIPYMISPDGVGFMCGGSEEPHSLYDPRVLEHFKTRLPDDFTYSSGLVYVNGENIYESFNMDQLFKELESHNYEHYFTEQTIFACLSKQSSGIIWPMSLIKNFHTDNRQITPMSKKGVIGRHYTANVRHLLWRDAFFNL